MSAFKEWVCVFPGKMNICWKSLHHTIYPTQEEAQLVADKNCNVVAIPLSLWENMQEYYTRTMQAERKLQTLKFDVKPIIDKITENA